MLSVLNQPMAYPVKSYGGKIGELMVIYINDCPHNLKKITEELKIIFKERLNDVYNAYTRTYLIEKYGHLFIDKFKPKEINKPLDLINNKSLDLPQEISLTKFLEERVRETNAQLQVTGVTVHEVPIINIPPVIADTDRETQYWIQDYFLSMQDENGKSWYPVYSENAPIACAIAKYLTAKRPTSMMNLKAPFSSELAELEGGNFLFGNNFALTNMDVPLYNLRKDPGMSLNSLIEQLKYLLNVKVTWLGDRYSGYALPYQVRDLHLDMVLTLGEENNNEQIVYLAELGANYYGENGKLFNEYFNEYSSRRNVWYWVQSYLENIKIDLERSLERKFKIIRIPCVMTFDADKNSNKDVHPPWYLRTFNNCISETINDNKIIYLPCYDGSSNNEEDIINFKQLHIDVELAYINNGFKKAIFINAPKEFDQLALKGGALNCITKILYRKP